MWKEANDIEMNRRLFADEFADFVPQRVLDFHVHLFNEGVVPAGEIFCSGGYNITEYKIEELFADLAEAFPGRECKAVCFGTPHAGYDQRRNDEYTAAVCDCKRAFPFRLLDPQNDTPELLRADLTAKPFLGIKPYLNYVRKADPNEVEINEMLPAWAMEIVNDLGLLVMLHIPRRERLADPLNQQQLVELCRNYPDARIVLAHVGRAYFLRNVVGYLENLKNLPNLYYDLAMVTHWEVMEHLFQTVAPERILYATDAPIACAPGKSIEINHQYTYVTPKPWKLSISDDHQKLKFTTFMYEEVRAIKTAVERLGLPRSFVEDLFYNNGMRLLEQVMAAKEQRSAFKSVG